MEPGIRNDLKAERLRGDEPLGQGRRTKAASGRGAPGTERARQHRADARAHDGGLSATVDGDVVQADSGGHSHPAHALLRLAVRTELELRVVAEDVARDIGVRRFHPYGQDSVVPTPCMEHTA